MPDALLAVLAFIGGAITNALIGAGTAEYRARRDHRREIELDRSSRDRQAAAAILEEVDRIIEKYSTRYPRHIDQSEIEPHYRVIRRRAVEIGDPGTRSLAKEIADGYYFTAHNANQVGEDEWFVVQSLQHITEETLGAVVRGDKWREPLALARFRKTADEADAWIRAMLGDDEADEESPPSNPEPDPK